MEHLIDSGELTLADLEDATETLRRLGKKGGTHGSGA
jgi:hypothetical protein